MRWLMVLLVLLAGCSEAPAADVDSDGDGFLDDEERGAGSDPLDATSTPRVHKEEPVSFSQTVNTVGTGVPTVQCPADEVNSQTLTWTIAAPAGDVADVRVTDLVFSTTGVPTVNDVDLFITGPDGQSLGSATGPSAQETIEVSGARPIGDYRIEVRGCSGAGEVDVEASGTLRWSEAAGQR